MYNVQRGKKRSLSLLKMGSQETRIKRLNKSKIFQTPQG